jgi:hypothetical protein
MKRFQDFDDFNVANEDNVLEDFLGIHKKDPNAAPLMTTTTDDQQKRHQRQINRPPTDQPPTTVKVVHLSRGLFAYPYLTYLN